MNESEREWNRMISLWTGQHTVVHGKKQVCLNTVQFFQMFGPSICCPEIKNNRMHVKL